MRNSDYSSASHLPNATRSYPRQGSSPRQPGLTPELTCFELEVGPEISWSRFQLEFFCELVWPTSLLSSKLYYIIYHISPSVAGVLYILLFLSFCLSFLFLILFMMGGQLVKKSKSLRCLHYFFHGMCLPCRSLASSQRWDWVSSGDILSFAVVFVPGVQGKTLLMKRNSVAKALLS